MVRALVAGVLLLDLSACVPVPMWSETSRPVRFSEETVASIRAGELNREQVQAALGAPDMRRNDDRYWAYGWSQGHGDWYLVPAAPMAGVNTGIPVYSTHHALFLEFDAAGRLSRVEPGRRSEPGIRLCDSRDHCIEHWDLNCIQERVSLNLERYCDPEAGRKDGAFGPDDDLSSFTVPAAEADLGQVLSSKPGDGCRLVLSVASELPEWGVEFNLDRTWEEPPWLPSNAFAVIDLPAGSHELRGCGGGALEFNCEAGELLALVIGDSRPRERRCASTTLPVVKLSLEEVRVRLDGKRRVLLPRPASAGIESADVTSP